MPTLDRKALEQACRRVADNTMWNTEPKSMSDIITSDDIEKVVAEYHKFASRMAKLVQEVRGDPNLVVRAVDYLAEQAIPPIKDDIRWFREGLTTIVELACPKVTGGTPSYHRSTTIFFTPSRWAGSRSVSRGVGAGAGVGLQNFHGSCLWCARAFTPARGSSQTRRPLTKAE